MWLVKLQDGKGPLFNKPQFATKFESHTMTSVLMLYITEPILNTRKIVTMDSCFCVAAGILALHDIGVWGQFINWPKYFPGQEIEDHLQDISLGHMVTYSQSIDRTDSLIHCQKDDRFVTKIMSNHGLAYTGETTQLIAESRKASTVLS